MRRFPDYQDMGLDDFVVLNDSHAAAHDAVAMYIKDLEENRRLGRGLTFMGPNGVGKTMLAHIVLNEAYQREYRVEAIEQASFVQLHKDVFLLSQINRDLHDDEVAERILRKYDHICYIDGDMKRCADWVLFDDIGREFPSESGWSQSQFFDTVRRRSNRRLPTIVTTNLLRENLEDRYTEGLTSFLMQATQIIVLEGDDYRATRLHRDGD